ncbi:substrate-binding domain-containing protein [Brachybacterium sacelli]
MSSAIASRVLNADPHVRVREETRQRIQDAAQSLGYVPHSLARSLRGARAGAIGLVMHGLDSPINVDVLAGAHARCAQSGYVTLLAEAEDLAEDDSRLRAFLARGRLDGVILHSGYGHDDRLLDAISRSVPAVLVNADDDREAPTVRVDDAAATTLAVSHLLELGHREITFIAGPHGSQTSDRREQGYRSALDRADLGDRTDVVHADWSADSGMQAVQEILRRPSLPTGLIVANAVTAAGVLSALRDAAVQVPDSISVITIHDSWFLPHLSVALTAVRLPLQALGAAAATLLIDTIDGRDAAQDAFITDPGPELVLRKSTGSPPARRA